MKPYAKTVPARPPTVVTAAATSALIAYVIDYHAVPKRVTPGLEARLSKRSLTMPYVALDAGFAFPAVLRPRDMR
ncbi:MULTISPECIES: hypothetical protein [unclassified Caballeronia]|uniref:hypothetical protein n=1 Tax=unclassified Caballeronia TaxID=2646786 RepID=UPI001F31EF12|nr:MULTISPECIES: hypothetical protein [unclassified Caballeronia]MCE4547564.1 hypothetical protein [Caballeronia sp. PC1]MCE4575023.1 hypothetical protein [Caballeronia sp. CLC5]